MPLIAAAVLPHAPLLVPGVGREHRAQLQRTLDAGAQLAAELYALQPQLLVVLTPHGTVTQRSFFVNVAESFALDLTAFGDLDDDLRARGAPEFAYRLKRGAERHHLPITLGTAPSDYGCSVPLRALTPCLTSARVVGLSPTDLPRETIRAFGQVVETVCTDDRLRVAVVASIELSHRAGTAAPAGATTAGQTYDRTVVAAIRQGDVEAAAQAFNPNLTNDVISCAPPILALLSGVLARRDIRPSILTYEAPFGVGELTAFFPTL